jgi:hypothetical protein
MNFVNKKRPFMAKVSVMKWTRLSGMSLKQPVRLI